VLVTAAAAIAFLSGFGAFRAEIDRARQPLAVALTLAALAGANGLIVSGDLFVMFGFLQWIWISLAALVGLGAEADRRAGPAAFSILVGGAVGALLFAFGVGLSFLSTGALDMSLAAGVLNAAEHARGAAAGLALMAVGLATLGAIAPLNGWALAAFGRGPAFVSLALGAVIVAAGAAATGRIMAFAASATAPGLGRGMMIALSAFGVISALGASARALAANDLRRMTVYAIGAQAGCVLIGFSAASPAGIAGALFHLANQTVAALCLYAAASALRGGNGASIPISALNGLFRRAPILTLAIAVTLLSLIGAPLTAGFLSRWSLLQAAFEARLWWGGAAIILSSLAAVIYAGRLFDRIFLRPAAENAPKPAIVSVAPVLALATGATLVFGFSGDWPLHAAEAAAGSLNWGGR
jgi:multicomponent Na+:H+ antiporter subunit D